MSEMCKREREEKRSEWVDKKSVITALTSTKLPSTASHHLFIAVFVDYSHCLYI